MLQKRKVMVSFVICVAFLLTSSCFTAEAAEVPKTVTIATHPKGSSLNVVGSGIAKVVSMHTTISALDRPFSGYSAWMSLLNGGSIDLGIACSPDLYCAYRGTETYNEKLKNLRLVSSGNALTLGYFVRAGSKIESVSDFKGKRIVRDPTGVSTKVCMIGVLKGAGLDADKDVVPVPVAGVAECVNAFIEGKAEIGWGSLGMGKMKEAAAKFGGIRYVSLIKSADDPLKAKMEENMAGGVITLCEAGKEPDLDRDSWLVGLPINLVTHKGMSEEAVYMITKAIWEHEAELKPIHPKFENWRKYMVSEYAASPYHPGAVRFYKEIGVWSDPMEKRQKSLLTE